MKWLRKFLPKSRQSSKRNTGKQPRHRGLPRSLFVEKLEDRLAPAVFAYSAATNPAIVDYTLQLNGANLQVVNTANTAQILAAQALAGTDSISITGQNGVNDTLRVNFA